MQKSEGSGMVSFVPLSVFLEREGSFTMFECSNAIGSLTTYWVTVYSYFRLPNNKSDPLYFLYYSFVDLEEWPIDALETTAKVMEAGNRHSEIEYESVNPSEFLNGDLESFNPLADLVS